jgi:hypothetical protein
MSFANCRAVVSWTASSTFSVKLDFLSHPAADVLSAWHSKQDVGSIFESKISIQMVIRQARNSSEFSEVLSLQSSGIINLHARPEVMF